MGPAAIFVWLLAAAFAFARLLRCAAAGCACERLLRAGQEVAALGAGAREPDPDPAAAPGDYRTGALRRVLRAWRRTPLYITDRVGRRRRAAPAADRS